jgi:hypothetical protein
LALRLLVRLGWTDPFIPYLQLKALPCYRAVSPD